MDDSRGNGLTFTENDLRLARTMLAAIGKAQFTFGFKETVEVAPALVWFANLVPLIERNILELGQVIQPPKEVKKK